MREQNERSVIMDLHSKRMHEFIGTSKNAVLSVENFSVKQFVHNVLKGFKEYEATKINFLTKIDHDFYQAVQKNDVQKVSALLAEGNKPTREIEIENIRLLTRESVPMKNFEAFQKEVEKFDDKKIPRKAIAIVHQTKVTKPLLHVALEKNAVDVAKLLLQHGARLDGLEKTEAYLSDYHHKSSFDYPSKSTIPYRHTVTHTTMHNPIVNQLVEKKNIVAMGMLIAEAKDQLNLNDPKISDSISYVTDGRPAWKPDQSTEVSSLQSKAVIASLQKHGVQSMSFEQGGSKMTRVALRPFEKAVLNKDYPMAKLLKENGAELRVIPDETRKMYRKLERDNTGEPTLEKKEKVLSNEKEMLRGNSHKNSPAQQRNIGDRNL